jgi:hypothetical protein
MIPGVYQGAKASEAKEDFIPPADAVEKMMKFNEELAKAGALISLDGLTPPALATQVKFAGGKNTVTDGPFAETKEVVGGYWIIRANSKEEAVDWARRVPAEDGDTIEVRQIFEMSDFPEDVQKAADSPTVKAAIGEG